jgi:hypothetical protein
MTDEYTSKLRARVLLGMTVSPEDFDRWLASLKADAWQDGAYWVADAIGDYPLSIRADENNPYRESEARND